MQRKCENANPHYFNGWRSLAKLLSLLIFVYCGSFTVSCRRDSRERVFAAPNRPEIAESALNINTAGAEDLEKLPRIGKQLAQRIIDHREKYGPFRRAENLILVRGMSDKKFREIRTLVKVN